MGAIKAYERAIKAVAPDGNVFLFWALVKPSSGIPCGMPRGCFSVLSWFQKPQPLHCSQDY